MLGKALKEDYKDKCDEKKAIVAFKKAYKADKSNIQSILELGLMYSKASTRDPYTEGLN